MTLDPKGSVPTMRSRPIVSDRPAEDVWKLLRLFLDTTSVADRIRELHEIPKDKYEADVRKQAIQLAQSLRQAEEYFRASRSVTLATRPTLAYYGAISLARALILLRRDGNYSLDALRAAERHNHHGLEIKKDFLAISADAPAEHIFEAIACELHVHRTEAIPWGNFPLFYGSLVPPMVVLRHTIMSEGAVTTTTQDETQYSVDLRPVKELIGRRLDLLTLIRQMPDMWLHIIDLKLEPTLCPGKTEMRSVLHPADSTQDPPVPERAEQEWDFFVWAATEAQRTNVKKLVANTTGMTVLNEGPTSLALRLRREITPGTQPATYVPDIVDSLTGRLFFIPEPETYVAEPAAYLGILFSLSMLARYYPDKWMAFIEQNVLVSELLDTVLNVIERKLPLLILDQLTGIKHYVQVQ
jgi:hypothetical protein